MDEPSIVARLVRAAEAGGARGIRVESVADLRSARAATTLPIVGLVKHDAAGDVPFITTVREDIEALAAAGADVIAFDGTNRPRPLPVHDAIEAIHAAGRLAMADCSTVEDGIAAWEAGADFVATTLSGYTAATLGRQAPDVAMVRDLTARGVRVVAEGNIRTPAQAERVRRMGAFAVTIGSAITRPEHVTAWFASALERAGAGGSGTGGRSGPPGTYLGVDIGGTKIATARVRDGRVLDSRTIATPRPATPAAVLAGVSRALQAWTEGAAGIGLACAGAVADGRVTAVTRNVFEAWEGVPLEDAVQESTGLPTVAVNDGQAAAWAEHRFGAGRGHDHVLFVTVSTGVGGGIVSDGRLLRGASGMAGHLGHLPLEPAGPPCSCGRHGCLEQFVSGTAIAAAGRAHAGGEATSEDVFERAARGEGWARRIVNASAHRLAEGIAAMRMLIDPGIVVLGGGVGLAPGYLHAVQDELARIPTCSHLRLVEASLGAEAGVIGAADLAAGAGAA